MKRLGIILAHAVDGMMARLWPLDPTTRAYMPIDVLAEAEEKIEVWEPPQWKWEPLPDHLRQFMSESDSADCEPWMNHTDPDELWAAKQRYAVEIANEQTLDEFVVANRHKLWPTTKAPASADELAATASTYRGAGGDNGSVGAAYSPAQGGAGRVTTDEVATVIAVTLRGQGINSAPIYADIAARELLHHFQISRK
jgi:hypothetical protein